MSDIRWPEKYLPGTTDNYVSNEVIIRGLTTEQVWTYLNDTTHWPTYYQHASEIGFDNGAGPALKDKARFHFTTFGMRIEAEITEYEPPAAGKPARVAWRARVDGNQDEAVDVWHAWLIEDLPGERVRVLTQESQIGEPAKKIAVTKPNPMLNVHQDWLEGLVGAAAGKTKP